MPEELTLLKNEMMRLKSEMDEFRYLLFKKIGAGPADVKANIVAPSTIPTAALANNSVTNAKMADDAIKQAELDTESVTVQISDTATSGTATITSGSIVIEMYVSAVTGSPTVSYARASISGTTLTITLVTAPGAGNSVTFTVVLLKA